MPPNRSDNGRSVAPSVALTPSPVSSLTIAPGASPVDANLTQVSLPLSHYLWVLRRHFWKLLAFVTVIVGCTVLATLRVTPIYESTSTLYVDRQEAKGIVGQESQVEAYSNLDADDFLGSQAKLIQSDAVVRPIAERYDLLEREKQIDKNKDAPSNQARATNAPIVLKRLKVVRPPSTYLLLVSYRSTDPNLAADVVNGISQSYIEHVYTIRMRSSASLSKFMERQLEELRAKMEASSARLAAMERELNLINPEEKTNILSTRLLQLNTEYTKVGAERARAESAYNSLKEGSLEAALASSQGDELRKILAGLNEANERFAEVKARYGENHPEYEKLSATVKEMEKQVEEGRQHIIGEVSKEYQKTLDQEALLKADVASTKAEYDNLNLRSFEYQRTKREADADKNLYEELVRKIREAEINAGFQNNMVRIADSARPAYRPVYPNMILNVILAFVLSTLLAVGAAVVSDTLDNTVRDPEHITKAFGAQVVGTMPSVKEWKGQIAPAYGAGGDLIAAGRNGDARRGNYGEAVRTLRNTILLADFDRRLRSIMVSSAFPSEGKSTIAFHLALAHAQQGRRTLIIDGDLRRPTLHRKAGLSNLAGLSDVLAGTIPWRDAVASAEADANLSVLPAGPPSRRASDLIGSQLAAILDESGREYDLVLLDSPPLLGFPEPLQMAANVDGVLLIVLAGETNRKAVNLALDTLSRVRASLIGVVLNSVRADTSHNYYYHYYHSKYYKYYEHRNRA